MQCLFYTLKNEIQCLFFLPNYCFLWKTYIFYITIDNALVILCSQINMYFIEWKNKQLEIFEYSFIVDLFVSIITCICQQLSFQLLWFRFPHYVKRLYHWSIRKQNKKSVLYGIVKRLYHWSICMQKSKSVHLWY